MIWVKFFRLSIFYNKKKNVYTNDNKFTNLFIGWNIINYFFRYNHVFSEALTFRNKSIFHLQRWCSRGNMVSTVPPEDGYLQKINEYNYNITKLRVYVLYHLQHVTGLLIQAFWYCNDSVILCTSNIFLDGRLNKRIYNFLYKTPQNK